MEYLAELQGIYKSYPGVEALIGADVNLPGGRILGLIGPNGSGKSTLLKIIAGLVYPDRGTVRVLGKDPREVKEKIAFSPELDHLYRNWTVGQTVEFVSAFYRDWQKERARELLAELELRSDARVKELSKGMRARLKLVLAMSRNAPLVLLDEPLSGIDPLSRHRILKGIVGAYQEGGQTLLISTHEVGDTESILDGLIVLSRGQVRFQGDLEDLRAMGKTIIHVLEEVQ